MTLEEELDGLEDYIYLQQMRFDGRITVEKQILVDPARARLPSFTLQPVIENAFSHGLKACEEGGRILLRVWRQGRMLYVTVADNGKGMTEEELAALSEISSGGCPCSTRIQEKCRCSAGRGMAPSSGLRSLREKRRNGHEVQAAGGGG